MVTAGTLHRERLFEDHEALSFVEEQLLCLAVEFGWQLEAWAVFSNHYHFVGRSPNEGSNLGKFTGKLHATTSRWLNKRDDRVGRQVWYSYHQTRLTYERSYLARLHYVMHNPVHHGLVTEARLYPYCSANWFDDHAEPAWQKVVSSFPIDRLNIEDEY